ncbi:hypothetical protein F5X68DRAFT_175888 [Plectosphaerella plurivora]|uniref:Something about silencing protein 4 domain-containing protein n=1 Tax=Plectosphaerella plurivora TaxID=936078 RepID=A0A9P8V2X9_9PEZI|nr:hypothetical protein F5X68DRAFT_175888 [Plectosphaerella plurivora]
MDRIRGNRPARRRTQPTLSSSFDSLDAAFPTDRVPARSPTMPFAINTTPQTAPQARRGTRQSSTPAAQPLTFSGSSPTAGKAKATRKRARIMGGDGAGDEDDDLPAAAAGSASNNKKGTHNLRKRPKIDYSAQDFEDEVPEIALAAPRTATRKKRDGSETFADDMTPTAQRGRRAASKTPARRPEHHYPYLPPSDDDVVKDTIEVIGDSSDLHGSDEFSDHDSKVESPAAEAKHSIVAQNDRHPPELPVESPQSKRPIIITNESPALPSPSTSAKATRRIEAEIAHPQPIHINHVSIISTDQSNGPTDVSYSPSHRNTVASSPREAKFTTNAVSPIPFPSTERRSLPSTPEAEAEAPPSLVVTLKLPRPLLQLQGSPEPQSEAPESVKKESQEIAPAVVEDVKRQAELGNTVTNGPENSEAVLEQEVDQAAEKTANDDLDMDADGEIDHEVNDDVHSVADDEAEAEAHEADSDIDDEPTHPWTHLSPYLAGEYVLHPEPTVVGGTAGEEGAEEEPEEADEEDADGEKDDEVNGTETTSTPQTPRRGTPAQFTLTGANTPVPSDKATGPKIPGVRRRKQYKFHKLRDPSEMQELLKDHESLSHEDLSRHLVVGAEWLESLQQEWQKLGRAIDDYENAKRRGQQDAEFEKKTADLDQFLRLESYVEKDFELRGYRAPLKDKDEGAQRTRWQDKVMAAAYGFEYDPHVSKVGNQDPLAQREGIMAGRQLRSQPQQTAKAAEAGEGGDGLVVVGKRTRNPPKLYDGLTPDDARAATPADSITGTKVMPKRRGRPPLSSLQHDAADTDTGKPPPKKRGPRGRKSEATIHDTDADTPGPSQEAIAPPPPVETQVNKRRRGPQSRAHVEEDAPGDMDEPDVDEPIAKRARTTRTTRGKPSLLRHNSAIFDAETEEDESRPTTSSSNGTISDAGSSYGVGKRQTKRTRNAREEADADTSPPQRKRPRINFKSGGNNKLHSSHSEDLLASTPSSLFPPSDHARIVTFRHLGANQWTFDSEGRPSRESSGMPSNVLSAAPSAAPSAPASTTSSAPPSQVGGDDSTKDYSTMTKSEKMSASMKKRWMNGSMQNAVNKRKATLAAKKAAAAALVTGATSSPAPAPAPAPAPTPAPAAQAYPQLQRPPQQRPFINMNGPQGPF